MRLRSISFINQNAIRGPIANNSKHSDLLASRGSLTSLEQGEQPFYKHEPLPLDDAPDRLRCWFAERWGGLRASSPIDERFEAATLLCSLGPSAAPAIPALARTMESEDHSLVQSAADTLQSMGPASWPAVQNILEHGSQRARITLFDNLYARFGPGGKDADPAIEAELPSAVATFIKAFHDPDPEVRGKAAYSLW